MFRILRRLIVLAIIIGLAGVFLGGPIEGFLSAHKTQISTVENKAHSLVNNLGSTISSLVPSTSPPTAKSGAQDPPNIVVANATGWSGSSLEGPVPTTCHYGFDGNWYLPDPKCTPGSIDPQVTQANIYQTICRKGGYTSSVRPPVSLTEPFKFNIEHSYNDPYTTSKTELDHLIPLSLGGASSTYNLWPQPNQGSPSQFNPTNSFGLNAKDGVEDALHAFVCAGKVSLQAAQDAIATNWVSAEAELGLAQ